MSIKTMLQKWLGITPEVKYVEVKEPKYVINGGFPVNIYRDPQKLKFPLYSDRPRNVKHFYALCGGYSMFKQITSREAWYTINQRSNDSAYPYVLIVFNRDCITAKGNPESRSLRAKSYQQAKDYAAQLMELFHSDHQNAPYRG